LLQGKKDKGKEVERINKRECGALRARVTGTTTGKKTTPPGKGKKKALEKEKSKKEN